MEEIGRLRRAEFSYLLKKKEKKTRRSTSKRRRQRFSFRHGRRWNGRTAPPSPLFSVSTSSTSSSSTSSSSSAEPPAGDGEIIRLFRTAGRSSTEQLILVIFFLLSISLSLSLSTSSSSTVRARSHRPPERAAPFFNSVKWVTSANV